MITNNAFQSKCGSDSVGVVTEFKHCRQRQVGLEIQLPFLGKTAITIHVIQIKKILNYLNKAQMKNHLCSLIRKPDTF